MSEKEDVLSLKSDRNRDNQRSQFGDIGFRYDLDLCSAAVLVTIKVIMWTTRTGKLQVDLCLKYKVADSIRTKHQYLGTVRFQERRQHIGSPTICVLLEESEKLRGCNNAWRIHRNSSRNQAW